MRWMLPLLAVAMIAGAAKAQVINPRITTDSSIDTSSAEAVVKQILRPGMTDEEKAVACWRFMLDHFYHFYPPREPDTAGDSRDFQKAINSYGFGPCFYNAPVLTALWEAAGFKHRSWTVTGHSIPEVFYDGARTPAVLITVTADDVLNLDAGDLTAYILYIATPLGAAVS